MEFFEERVGLSQNESETRLVSFLTLLFKVDRRMNPDLYTHSPVVGSDSKKECKKEIVAV